MRAGRALRRAIMDRLIEQVPEVEGRVYDRAAADTPLPYITLGPSSWTDASSDCIRGREQTVQVDVWDRATNKGALEDLTDAVADALDGWEADAITMHLMRLMLVRVIDDPDGVGLHGIVQVEAVIED